MVRALVLLLSFVAGSASAISHDHAHRLHHHPARLRRYVGAFIEMLNPAPNLAEDPEQVLTATQKTFLETASDPKNAFLIWQGAMKVAKEAGTHDAYLNPEDLLPRALHQVESAFQAEKDGDFQTAKGLRQEAAVDVALAMKTMGYLLGIQNQDRFWTSCIKHGKTLWNGRADPSSKRSLAFLESIELLFHESGSKIIEARKQRSELKKKMEKVAAVQAKIDSLKDLTPASADFHNALTEVTGLLQEAEKMK